MNFLKRVFDGVKPAYLIRAYIIGAAFFGLFLYIAIAGLSQAGTVRPVQIVMMAICTLLFPFAKLVWDEVMELMRGRTFYVMPMLPLLFVKFVINGVLWACAPLIAPLGILYIWFRTRPNAA